MKRGFPRPKAFVAKTSRSPYKKGYGKRWDNRWYPWPYTADANTISDISEGRMLECIYFKRCGTCGEPVKEENVGLILYNPRSPKISGTSPHYRPLLHKESGPYHLKCLVLNFTMCPHLAATKLYMPGYGKWTDVRDQILETYK